MAVCRLCAWITVGYTWLGLSRAVAGDIHGTAFEKSGSKPVPGVAVELYRDDKKVAETNTDAHGQYKIEFDSGGNYRIEFAMLPDHCEAPYVSEPSLNADAVKVENVFVYRQNEKANYKDLVDMIRKRVSESGDPTKAFDDLVALSTTGANVEILSQAGAALAKEVPYSVSPITGRIAKIESDALLIVDLGAYYGPSKGSTAFKTSIATIFIDESGKRLPFEKAKALFVGKESTVFSAKEGTDWVVKSVIFK